MRRRGARTFRHCATPPRRPLPYERRETRDERRDTRHRRKRGAPLDTVLRSLHLREGLSPLQKHRCGEYLMLSNRVFLARHCKLLEFSGLYCKCIALDILFIECLKLLILKVDEHSAFSVGRESQGRKSHFRRARAGKGTRADPPRTCVRIESHHSGDSRRPFVDVVLGHWSRACFDKEYFSIGSIQYYVYQGSRGRAARHAASQSRGFLGLCLGATSRAAAPTPRQSTHLSSLKPPCPSSTCSTQPSNRRRRSTSSSALCSPPTRISWM